MSETLIAHMSYQYFFEIDTSLTFEIQTKLAHYCIYLPATSEDNNSASKRKSKNRQKTTDQCKLAVNDKRKKIKSIEQLFVLHAWLFNFPIFEIIIV